MQRPHVGQAILSLYYPHLISALAEGSGNWSPRAIHIFLRAEKILLEWLATERLFERVSDERLIALVLVLFLLAWLGLSRRSTAIQETCEVAEVRFFHQLDEVYRQDKQQFFF
jgi:hypothetical protein